MSFECQEAINNLSKQVSTNISGLNRSLPYLEATKSKGPILKCPYQTEFLL